MKVVCVCLTVLNDVYEQGTEYIHKFQVARGKHALQIHNGLQAAYGESALDGYG